MHGREGFSKYGVLCTHFLTTNFRCTFWSERPACSRAQFRSWFQPSFQPPSPRPLGRSLVLLPRGGCRRALLHLGTRGPSGGLAVARVACLDFEGISSSPTESSGWGIIIVVQKRNCPPLPCGRSEPSGPMSLLSHALGREPYFAAVQGWAAWQALCGMAGGGEGGGRRRRGGGGSEDWGGTMPSPSDQSVHIDEPASLAALTHPPPPSSPLLSSPVVVPCLATRSPTHPHPHTPTHEKEETSK